jgi:hypothetical protein
MTHTVLTFIARVKPEKADELSDLLELVQADPEKNTYIPFRSVKSLHFASLVLHRAPDYGAYLIFENNFDGMLDEYLADLYTHSSSGLHQIYSYCQDYTVTRAGDREGILAYLSAHVVRPNAYHIGNTGRSAKRILQEHALRDALETQADGLLQSSKATPPSSLLGAFQNFVRSNPQFVWVPGVGPRQTFVERFVPWVKLVLGVLLALVLSPPALIGLLVLRLKESADPVQQKPANSQNLKKLVQSEDRTPSVQNHMASITIVKPGWLRRLTIKVVLWAINLVARATATHGELSGIPSIHFAHWSLIDNGRRLLFLSNFDGSWENYLDDFIDKASSGLTAVWSNTLNFPRTQFLILGGARDGPRFKAVARDSQTVTNAWYSAYWDLTVQGIDNNSGIREDILRPLSPDATKAWLHRL